MTSADGSMRVSGLWRYPVKGLRGEHLDQVMVAPNAPLPHDRRFALAHGNSGIAPGNVTWAFKDSFHMLMHKPDLVLSELTPVFDEQSGLVTIHRDGDIAVQALTNTVDGVSSLNRYFGKILGDEQETGAPVFVEANGFALDNIEEPVVSLINVASVERLSEDIGQTLDLARFRGNILIEGAEPWEERDWVGRKISIGDVVFEVTEETERCGATEVNSETCARDVNIPQQLRKLYGHLFCGVYLTPSTGGTVSVGSAVTLHEQ